MTTMMSLQQKQHSPRRSNLNPSAREWFPPGYLLKQTDSARSEPEQDQAANEEVNLDAVFKLSELPLEILSSVVGFLGSPQDLFSCILATHQLRAAVRSGRMSLQLSGRPRQLLSFPRQSRQLDDLVQSLTNHMPAMSACDLSMLPLEHTHVSKLAQGLHLLQHLDLSGCKKLQPRTTKQLLQGLASEQLQSLNLQRCFQLTDQCLTDVLEYACGSHSSSKALQCIALSHLNSAAWPAAAAADADSSSDEDNNSSGGSSSTDSGSGESGGTGNVVNNVAAVATGSTAAQWGDIARGLLYKLPKQLGAPLLSTGSTAALRMVVLNNCNMLTVSGLVSLAVACPQLEYLFLGGSTLKSPEVPAAGAAAPPGAGVYVPRSVAAAAAAAGGNGLRMGSATELPGALQQLSELLQLPQTLPWDVLSCCCDTGSCSSGCGQGQCSCACTCCSSARSRAQDSSDSGRDADDAEQQRARKRLHRNEPSASAVAAARGHALSLTYVAALLPGLKALDVTFMAPGLAGWLRVCLDRLAHLRQRHQQQHMSSITSFRLRGSLGLSGMLERTDSGSSTSSSSSDAPRNMLAAGSLLAAGSQRPKVWQFSCATAVADALQTLSDVRRAHKAADSDSSESDADRSASAVLSPECLAMAVKCAVNCSSRGRSTPLHMAADAGCACHIRALVAAGAAVAARDASGASALFVACESGQAAAASVLLEAGADALVGNTAGETPLYIAALRGHLSVVELLLGHLSAADVDWTQRQLYGDAWTPLMAAAVANRVSVALCLLRAAARLCCSSKPSPISSSTSYSPRQPQQLGSPGVTRLLAAENRYGQTVLHIAARKGCMELLQLLLVYGAGQVAGRAVDAAGDTPLDIARRHGHDMVVRELLQQC